MDIQPQPTNCRQVSFAWGERTFIMGIINLSPDSFSGDGLDTVERTVEQARRFVSEGADIIDVGAESTRPNSEPITIELEISRLVPAIQRLSRELDVPVSVDSYKFEVVKQSLEAGADIINDIWGLKYDARLAKLAADYRRPIIITSNQRDNAVTGDIIEAIKTDLSRAIEICNNAGVPGENIIIDPGVGFGKTLDQNLEIIRRLAELKAFGKPLLLGTSRKGMLGAVLGLPAEDRLEGSAATNAIGIACGADIIRVHDVKFLARVAKMSDAVVRGKRK